MRFKTIVSSTLLLLSSAGHGSENLQKSSNSSTLNQSMLDVNDDSMFNRLFNLYSEAMLPDMDSRTGGSVGRCYKKGDSSVTLNGAILIRQTSHDGPLGSKNFQVNTFWSLQNPANYFDGFSLNELERFAQQNSSPYLNAEIKDQAYVVNLVSTASKSYLRVYDDYIIELVTSFPNGVTSANVACYYYIKSQ